jgi:uncharacterized protein YndB with AHSA1/START domain
MKAIAIIVAGLAGIALLVTLIGLAMPRAHVATSEIALKQPIDTVYAVVRNLGGMPSWWADLKSSTRVTDVSGERWAQESGGFKMQLDVVDDTPPRGFVTNIVAEKGAAFGGRWVYTLTPTASGTTLRVSEEGWIGPPPFRVMATLGGLHRTIDGMLGALAKHFGEDAKPVHAK